MRAILFFLLIFSLTSCDEQSNYYNGYIDADMTYLASNFAGRLDNLLVRRGQQVNKDQLLFQLEQTNNDYIIGMSELTQKQLLAQKEELLSQQAYAENNYHRILAMRKKDAASQNDLELARTNFIILNNKLAAIDLQIKASALDTADKNWEKKRKQNYAKTNGIVYDTYFNQGEYVQAGQPIVSLITKNNIKAVFFVPEPYLSHLSLNQRIRIVTDGDSQPARGTISYIAHVAQYTPPIIYSKEERSRLVFRIEAHIEHPNLERIHLGQPVAIELLS